MSIPTIKIKKGDGYGIINESDFNPEIHELFEPKSAPIEEVKKAIEAVKEPPKPKAKAPAKRPRRKRRTKAEMEAARARGEK